MSNLSLLEKNLGLSEKIIREINVWFRKLKIRDDVTWADLVMEAGRRWGPEARTYVAYMIGHFDGLTMGIILGQLKKARERAEKKKKERKEEWLV